MKFEEALKCMREGKKVWVYIKGTDNYFVSNFGDVKHREYQRKPSHDKDGYLQIGLEIDGRKTTRKIHRLVAEAFIPNVENKPQVNHIDGDKENNRIDNLEWVTNSENQYHKYRILGYVEPLETRLKKRLNCGKSNKKKVVCVETGQEYDSARTASKFMGLHFTAVSSAIYSNRTCGGYHWKYKEIVDD